MTMDQFLDKLSETGPWRLKGLRGMIRSGQHCPLTAVHGGVANRFACGRAAEELGLTDDDTRSVIAAADNNSRSDKFDSALRERLLAVTVKREKAQA